MFFSNHVVTSSFKIFFFIGLEIKPTQPEESAFSLSSFFEFFDLISQQPFSFESVEYIKLGYRRCVCGIDSIFYKVNNDLVKIMAK